MNDPTLERPTLRDKLADLPGWAPLISYVGIPGIIVFYLLGMIPGMPSPADKANAAVAANTAAIINHSNAVGEQNRAIISAMSAICFRLPENSRAPRCPQ